MQLMSDYLPRGRSTEEPLVRVSACSGVVLTTEVHETLCLLARVLGERAEAEAAYERSRRTEGGQVARAPRHPCAYPGCSALVEVGISKCDLHKPKAWGKHAGVAYPSNWTAIRDQVLREEPVCSLCPASSTCVDHRVPRSEGGDESRSNLRALCDQCHARVTGQASARARIRANTVIERGRLFSRTEQP